VRNITWDEETDVVIVGCGGAGAVTAITASDVGAKVIVIEKGEGGGNTRLATMAFLCPTNNSAAREHIKALSFGMLGEDIIDVYVKWTSKNVDYIRELGGEVEMCFPGASFPKLPGSETMLRYRVKASLDGELGGESLWNLLSKNLERRQIPVHHHTIAKKIIRSSDEVVGVEAQKNSRVFLSEPEGGLCWQREGLSTTMNSRGNTWQVIRFSLMEMPEIPGMVSSWHKSLAQTCGT
jgi:3-oxosteroid 1-dehydrogenase